MKIIEPRKSGIEGFLWWWTPDLFHQQLGRIRGSEEILLKAVRPTAVRSRHHVLIIKGHLPSHGETLHPQRIIPTKLLGCGMMTQI